MSIRPEDITVAGLPRSSLPGGIKVDAAADLLQRVAWEYREVLSQARQLSETVGEQGRRIAELEAQIVSLEADAAARKDPDELSRSLLDAAHRTVRERREEARREAELLLKKAVRRAEKLELDAKQRRDHELSRLKQLDALREELHDGLRSSLEAIVALAPERTPTTEQT